MRTTISYASQHPAIADDRQFFAKNAHRQYRARGFDPTEIGLPPNVIPFAKNENGLTAEINLVILKRIKGGRARYHFATCEVVPLNSDASIKAFLRAHGQMPPQRDRSRRGS